VHASAAVVACVAVADDVGALVAVPVDDASGVAVGEFAVVPAQAAKRTERVVAAMSRFTRHIITDSKCVRGKTSLKT
jgi:hypothetical protein